MPQMKKVVTGAAGVAAVGAVLVTFTPNWEGMDLVAKRDAIGTGHPITYCIGQTDEFGKVKSGTRFTPAQCRELFTKSSPKYINATARYLKRAVPVNVMAALSDAAYNAGPAAVGKSPMVAKINAGDIRGGCEAFKGWYVRSAGQVRKGLVARRSGIGDGRKSERDLCLSGVNDPDTAWFLPSENAIKPVTPTPSHVTPAPAPVAVEAPKPHKGAMARLWSWLMETS